MKPLLRNQFRLLVFFFALLQASSGRTEENSGSIAVGDLISLVLSQNPDVRIADAQADQAEARWDSARSKYLPKQTTSVSYYRQDLDQFGGASSPGLPIGGQNGFTAKATLSLNVFNGFQDRHRELQRRKEFEKSRLDVASTRLSQFDRVIASIFTILRLQSDEQNIQEKIAIERERVRDLKKKVNAQSAKQSDLLSVEASLLGSESDLQTTLTDLKTEWQNLRSLSITDIPFQTITNPMTELPPIRKLDSLSALPDIRSAGLDSDAARLSAKASDGALLPAFDVSFNQYLVRPELQKNNRWDLQVTATIPFPFDGEKRAAIHEAEAAALQKEAAYLKKKRERTTEIQNLMENYSSDIERYATLSKAVEIQSSLVEALRKDYQYGLVGISDYLSAVSALLQKKQQRDHLFLQEVQRALQINNYKIAAGEKS